MNLLHIDSSPVITGSLSRELSAAVVARWRQTQPDGVVLRRDLGLTPPGHLSEALLQCLKHQHPAAPEDSALAAELALSAELIDEFIAADVIVIGSPMYNHTITSQLKAWLDRLCVPGKTFRYSAQGPVGLLADRPVVIVSTRGGLYADTGVASEDFQEPYLCALLRFFGLHSISIIRAEGVDINAQLRAQAITQARLDINKLFATGAPDGPVRRT